MANDRNQLLLRIRETLAFRLSIRIIHISNLIVNKDGNDIVVTFTLLGTPLSTESIERIIVRYTY
jgi:hypothetical protein